MSDLNVLVNAMKEERIELIEENKELREDQEKAWGVVARQEETIKEMRRALLDTNALLNKIHTLTATSD